MTLLYHRPSGITHVLLQPAPEILAALAGGSADAATLVARLGVTHAIDSGDDGIDAGHADAVAVIMARLDELAVAGLVAVAGDAG